MKQINNKIKFAEFFCGIGGFRLGLEEADMQCVFSCDIDKNCEKTYKDNFGKPFDAYDILKLEAEDIPEADLYVGGFPCQPFSIAGKRKALKDSRSEPLVKFLNLIKTNLPKSVILENVSNLLRIEEGNVISQINNELESAGYTVETKILNSKDFGVPQSRKRVFIIGVSKEICPLGIEITLSNNSKNKILRDVIIPNDNSIPISKKWDTYIDLYQGKISPSEIEFPLPKTRKELERKDVTADLEDCIFQIRSSGIRAISLTNPFPTLAVSDSGGGAMIPVYSKERRHLSLDELKKIMGFPDKFSFPLARTHAIKQLANAVCPPVVKSIGLDIQSGFSNFNQD